MLPDFRAPLSEPCLSPKVGGLKSANREIGVPGVWRWGNHGRLPLQPFV